MCNPRQKTRIFPQCHPSLLSYSRRFSSILFSSHLSSFAWHPSCIIVSTNQHGCYHLLHGWSDASTRFRRPCVCKECHYYMRSSIILRVSKSADQIISALVSDYLDSPTVIIGLVSLEAWPLYAPYTRSSNDGPMAAPHP